MYYANYNNQATGKTLSESLEGNNKEKLTRTIRNLAEAAWTKGSVTEWWVMVDFLIRTHTVASGYIDENGVSHRIK